MNSATHEKLVLAGVLSERRAFVGPSTVQLDITNVCTNSCIGCWHFSPLLAVSDVKRFGVLSKKKIFELLDEFEEIGVQEIQLSGQGEPLLHPDIIPIILKIKERHFRLNIVTSFLQATPEIVEAIICSEVDLLTISLWAGDAQTYVATHPKETEESFKTICDNLMLLDELRWDCQLPKIKHYHVICSKNCNGLNAMLDFAIATRADMIEFQHIDIFPGIESLALGEQELKALDEQIAQLHKAIPAPLAMQQEPEGEDFRVRLLGGQDREFGRYLSGVRIFHESQAAQAQNFTTAYNSDEFCLWDFIFSYRVETLDGQDFIQRFLTCPHLKATRPTANNPHINEEEKTLSFHFELSDCRSCPYKERCCPDTPSRTVVVHFLSLADFGTFYRKAFAPQAERENDNFFNTVSCHIGWTFSRILSDGSVAPCCKGSCMPMGNVNKQSFRSIWFSETMNDFRNKAKNLPKNDPYFAGFKCLASCDNVGQNLDVYQKLMELNPFDIKYLESVAHRLEEEKLELTSRYFETDKLLATINSPIRDTLGFEDSLQNLSRGENEHRTKIRVNQLDRDSERPAKDETFEVAHESFTVLKTGQYDFFAHYASPESRPVTVLVDGAVIREDALATPTGGPDRFHIRSKKQFSLFMEKGQHSIALTGRNKSPHIDCLELRYNPEAQMTHEALELCNEDLYPKNSSFKILLHTLKRVGLQATMQKVMRYIMNGSLANTYLDAVGIFSERYAAKGPDMVQIDLTYDCFNNCMACWLHSPLLEEDRMPEEKKQTYLPLDKVKELIDGLYRMRTREILLAGGGEPFLHPDLFEIIKYIKNRKMICSLNTCFGLVSKEIAERLIALEVDNICVSVWAGTPETYVKTHPNQPPETFRNISEALSHLNTCKKNTPVVKVMNVISELNFFEMEEMVEFARKTQCEAVEFTMVDTIPGRTDSLLLSPEQERQLLDTCRILKSKHEKNWRKDVVLFRFDQFMRRISNEYDGAIGEYDKSIIGKVPCTIGWLFARVNPDGTVNSCLKSHRLPIGSINEKPFAEIWNGGRQQSFREQALKLDPTNPLFHYIGNDACAACGCFRTCDDLGRLVHMDQKMKSLTMPERLLVNLVGVFLRAFGPLIWEKCADPEWWKSEVGAPRILQKEKKKTAPLPKNENEIERNLGF